MNGNYVDGSPEVSNNNWLGVVMNNGTEDDKMKAKQITVFAAEDLQTQSAEDAYNSVLASSGASFKRDTLDQRIINNVKNKTGTIIDVQGGFPHGSTYDISKSAWPFLKSLPSPLDSDKDGMPDDWEKKNGLNPNDASDASKYNLNKHYTNIEVYINSILKPGL